MCGLKVNSYLANINLSTRYEFIARVSGGKLISDYATLHTEELTVQNDILFSALM